MESIPFTYNYDNPDNNDIEVVQKINDGKIKCIQEVNTTRFPRIFTYRTEYLEETQAYCLTESDVHKIVFPVLKRNEETVDVIPPTFKNPTTEMYISPDAVEFMKRWLLRNKNIYTFEYLDYFLKCKKVIKSIKNTVKKLSLMETYENMYNEEYKEYINKINKMYGADFSLSIINEEDELIDTYNFINPQDKIVPKRHQEFDDWIEEMKRQRKF